MDPLKLAITIIGGRKKVADLFAIAPQAVSQWRIGSVPADRCPAIERATRGIVRCEQLRPDIDWAVLRNSDCQEAA